MRRAVQRAIDSIPETAWTPVRYPGAVHDPDTGAWISDAPVSEGAEVSYTAFDGEPPAFRTPDPIRSGPEWRMIIAGTSP